MPNASSVELPLPATFNQKTAMRTTIVLDDALLEQAFALTGARTKRELVHLALSEFVGRSCKPKPFEIAGKVALRPDFDHKAMRRLRDFADRCPSLSPWPSPEDKDTP